MSDRLVLSLFFAPVVLVALVDVVRLWQRSRAMRSLRVAALTRF
jgi:hypothetical protein